MGVDIVGYNDIVGLVEGPGPAAMPHFGGPFGGLLQQLMPHMQQQQHAPALPAGAPGSPAGIQHAQHSRQDVSRRQIAPFPLTTLPASGTVTMTTRPQRHIRIERVVLQSDVAPSGCSVTEFNVGAKPQFVNSGNVPISVFGSGAFDTSIRGNTAQAGLDVIVALSNSLAAAEHITGAILGEAVEL